ncbi:MAG: response regulator, partial [Anaerolineae bacterium]|nr:response regulator [Anaerolineae bacterium]
MDKPKRRRPPLRLLLVEDNKHDVLAFKRSFKDSGVAHHITHYPRAETALNRLTDAADDFDLVICDYNLPGMSGFEMCKSLLAQNIDLPLVLLTGDGAETLAVEAIKAGVNDYIVKDPNQGYLSLLPVILPEVMRQFQDRRAR